MFGWVDFGVESRVYFLCGGGMCMRRSYGGLQKVGGGTSRGRGRPWLGL